MGLAMVERPAEFPSSTTRFCGLIGDPVEHSRSAILHNAGYQALGLDIAYGAFKVREGEVPAAISGARSLGFLGLSVTMPHKLAAAAACDQASAEVEALAAANTVVFRGGVATALNTDGAGFVEDLERNVGLELDTLSVCVIGAGGAARAVIYALGSAGVRSLVVVNRDEARAEFAASLAPQARVGAIAQASDADLVVHATPLGMGATVTEDEAAAIAALAAPLGAGQFLVDLIVTVETTPLMAAAEAKGARVRNGLGMLVHQATRQFELFTGYSAPVEAMWAAVA